MNSKVKIAAIQMGCSSDPKSNMQKALAKIAEAARMGADIVCLPELFQHRYFPIDPANPEAFKLAEPLKGEAYELLSKAAKEHKVHIVGGSIFEVDNGTYYNTALTFDDEGKLLSFYRKCHIPQDPGFNEKDYFKPGDALKVIDTKFGKIAVMICYDQWFPEAARICVLRGAKIIIYPTAIGDFEGVENITGDWRKMWQGVQQGHAGANNVYTVGINRIGTETSSEGVVCNFFGGSYISDYATKHVTVADREETIIMAELDLARQQEVQEAWRFLPSRRPDLYKDLVRETGATGLLR